ncbi:MAG TPA: FkbM family methyltransferase [Limnobacter sp.]|nr:FkbM family methyltransferase [Limnobacter sp.]
MQSKLDHPTIFVSLASFCDPLLQFTLTQIFSKATHPARVFVGVVDQSADNNREWAAQQSFYSNLRYLQTSPVDSLGVSWARNLAFGLYRGEDFLLQVDSHTLFDVDWDQTLLDQMASLQKRFNKPLITTYPPPFELDAAHNPVALYPKDDWVHVLRPQQGETFSLNKPTLGFAVTHQQSEADFLEGHHVAGGFIFTRGGFVEEVPYDPYLYFHGEEQALALRAYTHGYTILHPKGCHIPLYHLYKQPNTAHTGHHWQQSLDAQRPIRFDALMQQSNRRLTRLIQGDVSLGKYGLGCHKSAAQFARESGIDYQRFVVESPRLPERPSALRRISTAFGDFVIPRWDAVVAKAFDNDACAGSAIEWLIKRLAPGAWVLEVGSSYGEHTVALARQVGPSGGVIAVEPSIHFSSILQANVAFNLVGDCVQVKQIALGDVVCRLGFKDHYASRSGACTILAEAVTLEKADYAVECLTVDSLTLPALTTLKINTNGFEAAVLAGAVNTLAAHKPIVMLPRRCLQVPTIVDLFNALEYSIQIVGHSGAESMLCLPGHFEPAI